jgi:hypothetical protein
LSSLVNHLSDEYKCITIWVRRMLINIFLTIYIVEEFIQFDERNIPNSIMIDFCVLLLSTWPSFLFSFETHDRLICFIIVKVIATFTSHGEVLDMPILCVQMRKICSRNGWSNKEHDPWYYYCKSLFNFKRADACVYFSWNKTHNFTN